MKLKSVSFMSENKIPNNINNDFDSNSEESDYKDLINKLNKIKATIALLEKTIFR